MIIGIDLGTTNSVAAFMTADGPQLIPNALGESLTPSVVGIDLEGKLLVGRAAKELQVLHPERCAALFKRYMGSDWTCELAGRSFTPEQLSGFVLRSLKDDAEAHFDGPVNDAVITVPAYFNEHQRRATLNAGRIAGLDVKRILNEPTAAAIAYGMHQSQEERLLAVIDLGGGTFDVSIVDQFESALEVRASSGESFLGGEDFTRTIAARILESQGHVFERAELEFPRLVSRMIQQCEVAKCRLSRQSTAEVRVPDNEGEFHPDSPPVAITREQVEKWCQHIVARIELPIRRTLGDARLQRADLDEVILVGGATRMPMVIERSRAIIRQRAAQSLKSRRSSRPGRRRAGRAHCPRRERVRRGRDRCGSLHARDRYQQATRLGTSRGLFSSNHQSQHDHSGQPRRTRSNRVGQPNGAGGTDLSGRKPSRREQPVVGRIQGIEHSADPPVRKSISASLTT